jgi:hypothetical protein
MKVFFVTLSLCDSHARKQAVKMAILGPTTLPLREEMLWFR